MCGTPLSILPSSTSRVQGIGRLCKFNGWYKGFTNQQNSGLNQQHWITLVKETHGTFSWPLEWWVKIRTSGKMEELKKVFQDHTRRYMHTQACQTQCMGTSQSDIWNSVPHGHSQLFFQTLSVQSVSPAILRFALGWSLCDTHIASDQFRHWSATWSPQVGTCSCRYHPTHYYIQSTKGIQRWGWLLWMAAGKRWWGGTTNES